MNQVDGLQTATFAMGCFWCPDSLFGSLHGVIRTRVGYSGGTSENPDYRNIGDHTEAIEIEYDPSQLSFEYLLKTFWENHTPIYEPYKNQYKSILFFHNLQQQKWIIESKDKAEAKFKKKTYTSIQPYTKFYLAEDYHQKYKLQRNKHLMKYFDTLYPFKTDFINSTLAARVNGFVDNKSSFRNVQKAIQDANSSPEILCQIEMILKGYSATKNISCS